MCKDNSKTLLLVLPGAAGRLPVLKRLQAIARVCVLVPSSELARSSWAREEVGDELWVQWEGGTADGELACRAVDEWLAGNASRSIDGVMSYDEFGVQLASLLGGRLGVPCTPVEQIRAFRDKVLFREQCQAAGVPTARHAKIHAEEDVRALLSPQGPGIRFPCVLKPAKGAGSWNVMKIESAEDLLKTSARLFEELASSSFPQETRDAGFTLEEFFQGSEVDVDGWARNGKIEFMQVADNRPALEPHFSETGGIYPSQLPPAAVSALEELTRQVVAAFPGVHCCFHFEARVNPETNEVMPIEFNARTGGAECPASVEAVTGYYLPEVAAQIALGLPVVPRTPKYQVVASTNIHVLEHGILTECSAEEVDKEACHLVSCSLFGRVGQPHVPGNGSQSCLGWMAAGGQNVEEAERRLQEALDQTRISVSAE